MNNPDLKLTNPDLKLMQSQIRIPDANQSLLCHFTIWFHQETPRDRKSAATFVVANAIMFAAPLEALAETCEPNYVGLSMPVLLAVALVGATVGVQDWLRDSEKESCSGLMSSCVKSNTALRRQAKIESYAPKLSSAVQRNQEVRKQNGHGHGHTHGHGHLPSSAVIVH